MRITLAHSPDADDAFMFYGIAQGLVETHGLEFVHELKDIQALNELAREGVYDVTAISVAAYPEVADKYQILTCGASLGVGYGPIVVSVRPLRPEELKGARIAIPGEKTSAYLALRLFLRPSEPDAETVFFDDITRAVLAGEFDAGVLIHEGQVTYTDEGLHLVADLGKWWSEETALPLPLGEGRHCPCPPQRCPALAGQPERSPQLRPELRAGPGGGEGRPLRWDVRQRANA